MKEEYEGEQVELDRVMSPLDRVVSWGLTGLFLVVAVTFLQIPQGGGIPIPGAADVSPEDLDISPRFQTLKDPPVAMINGFERTCMDCHQIIDSQPRSEKLLQHEHIHLDHGFNAQCVNCHHPEDRNKLVARDGTALGYTQSEVLCAQCHGTTYRAWQRGIHGKTLGYWDEDQGEPQKLRCTECHNPHAPRYEAMAPLPAPNTLRMGTPDPDGHSSHEHGADNPLLRARAHSAKPTPGQH